MCNISTTLQNYYNNLDGAPLYLIFQPVCKTITITIVLILVFKNTITELKSKGLSNEIFACSHVANVSVCSQLVWINNSEIVATEKDLILV